MNSNPLDIIKELDIELFQNVNTTAEMAMKEGALSIKHKLLMAMALDAAHGTVDGVRSLAAAAKANGASREEIMESIRVAGYISGVGCVYTAAAALKDLF